MQTLENGARTQKLAAGRQLKRKHTHRGGGGGGGGGKRAQQLCAVLCCCCVSARTGVNEEKNEADIESCHHRVM